MDTKEPQNQPSMNITVDPAKTPILYAEVIGVTSNENGFVIDVAQGIAGTNQAIVVARIGLSQEHAQKLAKLLAEHIVNQGQFTTGGVKIVN